MNKILSAARQASIWHKGQMRDDGITPYDTGHLAIVAGRTALHPEATEDLVCAMYLHDSIEDVGVHYSQIEAPFGKPVAELVWELTSWSKQQEYVCKQAAVEYFKPSRTVRKHEDALYLAEVSRLAKIGKLVDRITNLRDTLAAADPEWALRYADETRQLLDIALTGVDSELELEMRILLERIKSKYAATNNL